MYKILITTVPFGLEPLKKLQRQDVDYLINPFGRKMTEAELMEIVPQYDIIIAGTDPISELVIKTAKKLKMISRVGIGLNSVDLNAAKESDIKVSYTPEGPTPAVAELTVNLMLSLLRSSHISNSYLHQGEWKRFLGRRLGDVNVGIIGFGRIGRYVYELIKHFQPRKIFINDIEKIKLNDTNSKVEFADKETIYQLADVISIHLPLGVATENMISYKELKMMKPDAILVNTARGSIINENDLYKILMEQHLGGVALDVFEHEPYHGQLSSIERCLLTAHIGPMTKDCRTYMEMEAIDEVIRFIDGQSLCSEVPIHEVNSQLEEKR